MTTKSLLVMAAGICAAGLAFNAEAIPYDLNSTFGGVTINGTLDITGTTVTGGSITVSGAAKDGTFTVTVVSPTRALDGTDIIFDNQANLSSSPMFTGGGIGFVIGPIDSSHAQYVGNIWGNGDGSYSFFEAGQLPTGGGHVYNEYDGGKLTLTPSTVGSVPDGGSTLTLLGLGLTGLAAVKFRMFGIFGRTS